jgi:hypothetical protein
MVVASLSLSTTSCGPGLTPGTARPDTREANNSAGCAGEQYLDVFNPLTVPVDIYGMAGPGAGQFIATAARGRSRIALAATSYEKRWAWFVAKVGQQDARDVTVTRRCGS